MEKSTFILAILVVGISLVKTLQEEWSAYQRAYRFRRSRARKNRQSRVAGAEAFSGGIWSDPYYVCRKYLQGQLGGIPAENLALGFPAYQACDYKDEVVTVRKVMKPKEVARIHRPDFEEGVYINGTKNGLTETKYKRRRPQDVFRVQTA